MAKLLIIEDDGMDPTRATTNLTKLIRQDKVLAVIGPFGVAEATVRPVTEREQVPQILPAPSGADVRALKYKWSFNIAPNEILAAEDELEAILNAFLNFHQERELKSQKVLNKLAVAV